MKFLVCAALLATAFAAESDKKDAKEKRSNYDLGSYGSSVGSFGHDDLSSSFGSNGLDLSHQHGLENHGEIHHITLHKKVSVPVPHPVPYPVEKRIPYPVNVPVPVKVDKPYPVHVAQPYPVHIDKPYPVKVEKTIPYPVKVPVKVPFPVKVAVPIPKPYPVPVHKPVPVHIPEYNIIKKQVPVLVKGHELSSGAEYFGNGLNAHNSASSQAWSSLEGHALNSGLAGNEWNKGAEWSNNGLAGNGWNKGAEWSNSGLAANGWNKGAGWSNSGLGDSWNHGSGSSSSSSYVVHH